jgi:putative transposase
MCEVLEVSSSGFYEWFNRGKSERELADGELTEKIREIFDEHHGRYGSPRIHDDLIKKGIRVSRKRVARLMREAGLFAAKPKRFRKTTMSDHDRRIAPNVLDRNFETVTPDVAWAGDITYIWTDEGWLYLAILLDLASRFIVGWAITDHMRDELTLDALNHALARRQGGQELKGLIHHTDRGSQYASDDYIKTLESMGIVRSMSRRGDCWDNAVSESFFATLKKELIYRRKFATKDEAVAAIAEYIEVYYNCKRAHSSNHYMSPKSVEAIKA